MAKIYISSTYSDLKTCREAVYHALRQMRHDVIAMEDYVATDQRPTEKCLVDVAASDLYIGLFAWRYGYIPSEKNSEHKSITELEYRKAFQEGKPRLLFLLNKDAPWPSTAMDAITGEGNHGKHITALRQELAQEKLVSFFKTPEHLSSLVSAAVHLWEQEQKTPPITQPDFFDQRAADPGTHTQSFDHLPCHRASLVDLELGKVNEFFRRELVQRQEDFRPEVPLQAQLVQFGLLRESYPTHGALLCFGQNPQSWLTGATTRCIYWSGNTRNSGYLDDRDCRGDLLAQFESSLNFLRKCLRFSRIIGKEGRTEQYEIPLVALQEAIANALVHREYARMNGEGYVGRTDCIQVEVFDSRVEIKSPGPLPSDMTLDMLHIEDISHPRNPLIVRIFYLYGHVEHVGSGIRRMQDAMEDADLPPPRFELSDAQTFKVILERPQQIPEEIQESSEFGQLLNLGLDKISIKKHQSLEQVVADISTSVGAKNISLIHKWRHGQIPTPRQIAFLAQTCVQSGGMDQAWLTSFLKATNYPDPTTLIAELYPKSLQRDLDLPFQAGFVETPLFNIPFQRNPFFTGRDDLLTRLHAILATGKQAALSQPQAISGLGGIGKTQTAIEYAYRYHNDYNAIFWLKAESRETLLSDFLTLAQLLNLPQKPDQGQEQVVEMIKDWFQSHTGWLLIFDHADDLAMIRDYLPAGGKGHILLTTRSQVTGNIAKRIDIERMKTEEGTFFLLHRAGLLEDATLDAISEVERASARELVEEVGGLPLALDQAGAFIEETQCGLTDYLHLYRTRQAELLQRRGRLVTDHPESVATTWSLSFEKVEQANPVAADLLRLCAFLDPDVIPEELITTGASELGPTLQAVAAEPMRLNEAIADARTYSLLRRNPDYTLTIHRLVQAVLKQGMNKSTQRRWAERAVRAVNQAFPEVDYSTWLQCQHYMPQVQACAALIDQWGMTFPETAQLLMQAGNYLEQSAQYAQAEPLLQRALAIREKMEGPEHPNTGATLHQLAILYVDQGKYEQAEPLYQRALAIREKMEGPEHPWTAATLHQLAILYADQGKYEQAEPLYQRALAIREKMEGPEHPSTADTLHQLAVLYHSQGNYAQAEPLYQRALAIREKILGPEHPDTATTLHALAVLYWWQDKYELAEPLLQRALAINEKMLGPDHPNTVLMRNNYTDLLQVMKQ